MKNYTQLPETELVILLKEGDHAAYSEIYKRFFDLLYVFTFRRLNDEEEAKGILEEVFANLWTSRDILNISGPLSAYLSRTLHNKMINMMLQGNIEDKHMESITDFIERLSSLRTK